MICSLEVCALKQSSCTCDVACCQHEQLSRRSPPQPGAATRPRLPRDLHQPRAAVRRGGAQPAGRRAAGGGAAAVPRAVPGPGPVPLPQLPRPGRRPRLALLPPVHLLRHRDPLHPLCVREEGLSDGHLWIKHCWRPGRERVVLNTKHRIRNGMQRIVFQ